MDQQEGFGFLDALAIFSVMLGLASYSENLGQTQFQESLDTAMRDLHQHLVEQDKKIESILNRLPEEEQE